MTDDSGGPLTATNWTSPDPATPAQARLRAARRLAVCHTPMVRLARAKAVRRSAGTRGVDRIHRTRTARRRPDRRGGTTTPPRADDGHRGGGRRSDQAADRSERWRQLGQLLSARYMADEQGQAYAELTAERPRFLVEITPLQVTSWRGGPWHRRYYLSEPAEPPPTAVVED